MNFKKWIVSGLVVASLMVMSQFAFADSGCEPCKKCKQICKPGQGCEVICPGWT